MPSLAQAIMEQARMGRTITVRRVNVLVGGAAASAPQMIEMTLTSAANQFETSIIPTHGKDGNQLGDEDLVAVLQLNADKLGEREQK